MNVPDMAETLSEVLETARAAAGFEPSEKQRKDWRGAGLIPRHLLQRGSGRERGSTTYYPPGTGELLAAVCRHSKPKKPLPQLAFLVWWDGRTVEWEGQTFPDPALVRSVFSEALEDWEQLTCPWASLDNVPDEEWKKLDRMLDARLPASLRTVRARVGKKPFRSIVATLLNVAAGGFKGFRPYEGVDESDVHGDARAGLGTDQASWISKGLVHVLPELSAALNPRRLRAVLETVSPSKLEQARDEVRGLVAIVDIVSQLSRLGMPEGQPFVHLDRSSLSTGHLAMVLLWWLSASDSEHVQSMQQKLLPVANWIGGLQEQLEVKN